MYITKKGLRKAFKSMKELTNKEVLPVELTVGSPVPLPDEVLLLFPGDWSRAPLPEIERLRAAPPLGEVPRLGDPRRGETPVNRSGDSGGEHSEYDRKLSLERRRLDRRSTERRSSSARAAASCCNGFRSLAG